MKKLTRVAAAAIIASAPMAAFAASQTGNLNVTTTIQVSCDAPSPSGTLNLPFSSALALDKQAIAATPVTVTVTCYGNPTVNHVDFGLGTHRAADPVVEEEGVRYMLRSGVATPTAASYLGYKLWAAQGTGATSAQIQVVANAIQTDTTTNNNRIVVDPEFAASFQVTGQVFESARAAFANSGAVPGGTYNDIVVMTIDYN